MSISFCYVDESGSAEVLSQSNPASTPIFVIGGIIVPLEQQIPIVRGFLELKKRAHPDRFAGSQLSEVIAGEIKGSDLEVTSDRLPEIGEEPQSGH